MDREKVYHSDPYEWLYTPVFNTFGCIKRMPFQIVDSGQDENGTKRDMMIRFSDLKIQDFTSENQLPPL